MVGFRVYGHIFQWKTAIITIIQYSRPALSAIWYSSLVVYSNTFSHIISNLSTCAFSKVTLTFPLSLVLSSLSFPSFLPSSLHIVFHTTVDVSVLHVEHCQAVLTGSPTQTRLVSHPTGQRVCPSQQLQLVYASDKGSYPRHGAAVQDSLGHCVEGYDTGV